MSDRLSYGSYLKVNELLALQQPLSRPEHHDEMLFIIIHQVYELWFKQLLHELDAAIAELRGDNLLRVAKKFRRIHTIQRLLEQQIDVLETMTPQEFNALSRQPESGKRLPIHSISGGWSFSLASAAPTLMQHIQMDDAQRARLERRLEEASHRLYDDVKDLLARRGFASDSHDARLMSLRTIYTEPEAHYDLYLLLEDLIEFDERFLLWRHRHVRMVERMIGNKIGTGGSSGAEYLQRTLAHKFFPELWEVRTLLGGDYAQS